MTVVTEAGRWKTGLLRAPQQLESKLRFVPYAPDAWCPLLKSVELKKGSIKRVEFLGKKVAVFRSTDGAVGALLDRCPHRGVELSLGRVRGTAIQCAYHGWKVDACGSVVSPPGLGRLDGGLHVECFELRERFGVIWAFTGSAADAESIPLPDLAPYGTAGSVDILVRKDVRAHWSFVLDNGLDLFHEHLHRDISIFFRIQSLEAFGSDGTRFDVHYKAIMSSHYGRRRPGDLRIRADDNLVTLNLNGFPIIHSIVTPHSADGLQLSIWWFIASPGPNIHRLLNYAVRPIVRRSISRGFDQDVRVLESEQRAFGNGLRSQNELNPVVIAAHRHFEQRIVALVRAKFHGIEEELISAGRILEQARAGCVAVIIYERGDYALAEPVELGKRFKPTDEIRVRRHGNLVVIGAD
jgi:phenylpropionate dioxygenase-like ring-hydroxylating dioxygenase large terminal subunit